MNRGLTVGSLALVLALAATEGAPRAQQQAPVFRAVREMVLVDVVVRDRNGAVVKGLTANDFEVLEDGRPQQVLQFSYQELKRDATAIASKALLGDVESRVLTGAPPATAKPATPAASAANAPADKKLDAPLEDPKKYSSDELAGRRLMILLFDTSSMQPEDVQRSIDSAKKYVDEKMTPADLIAVATISTTLDVLTDFTGDRAKVSEVLNKLAYTDGTATAPPDASTLATDEILNSDDATTTSDTSELDMFNNDVRLRAIQTLAESLTSIEQKKAIVYFSAGMQRSGCRQPGRASRRGERRRARERLASTRWTRAASRPLCRAATRRAAAAAVVAVAAAGEAAAATAGCSPARPSRSNSRRSRPLRTR